MGVPVKILITLVNACTGINLMLGIATVISASLGYQRIGALCLLSSVIFDAADGTLARLWGVSSEFGAQFDSLADMTSFITAGSVLTFFWFAPGLPLPWIGAASGLYVLTGACRLARFNSGSKVDGEFQGLPSTAMAALVATTYLSYPQLNCLWGLWLTVTLSLLMVSYYPYPKLNRILRYPRWIFGVIALVAVVCFKAAVWLCAVGYIVSGPLVWLRRKLS